MIKNSIILFSLLALAACHKPQSPLENYDRATMLKTTADSVITPSYVALADACNQLNTSAVSFSGNVNAGTLTDLRNNWNNAIAKWMRCEMFNFEYANANSLNNQIDAWPVDIAVIESEIHGSSTIDESYIASTGTTRKGLSALEDLLYGANNNQQEVLDSFTTSAFAARRLQYLQAVCAHIKTQSQAAATDWNGGTSYNHFISQTQLDISGSMNLLVNGLIEHIEFVRKNKVGKPLGTDNGGVADGSLAENRYAPRSIENIKENIAAWRDIITAKSGTGLDDYLDHVDAQYNGQKLSTALVTQMDVCIQKADAVTLPLSAAVTQQQSQVQALYLELKKLTVMTKADMSSSLGVIITFSDNDGD